MVLTPLFSYCQDVVRKDNKFQVVTDSITTKKTDFIYIDKKYVEYPIYISKNGRAFIIKTSKNGNNYNYYLGEKISKEICKELNIEYKEK